MTNDPVYLQPHDCISTTTWQMIMYSYNHMTDHVHLQSHKNWCCTSTITRQMIMYILWPHNNWCCTRTIPRQMMYIYNHITTDAVHLQAQDKWCCTSTSTGWQIPYKLWRWFDAWNKGSILLILDLVLGRVETVNKQQLPVILLLVLLIMRIRTSRRST